MSGRRKEHLHRSDNADQGEKHSDGRLIRIPQIEAGVELSQKMTGMKEAWASIQTNVFRHNTGMIKCIVNWIETVLGNIQISSQLLVLKITL